MITQLARFGVFLLNAVAFIIAISIILSLVLWLSGLIITFLPHADEAVNLWLKCP